MSGWILVPKPVESSVTSMDGNAEPWGLLAIITSVTGGMTTSITSGWTDINKPTNSVWTFVNKPTS